MKVNERRTVVGVDWPLCVPPNRGERSTPLYIAFAEVDRK